ncbi:hypothetical protein P154DRAFT_546128 [Amniculicola lignicola CBS 123094]|uniref:Polyprenal reductase n=1 Tax=Amniculicola lignicola CBS 123094 TaxID=1392246 RepID=A0A6A5WDT3_9PLEO|nr:hypothetical protein P154DRAFT_546128 [Amniculicola lignicola CBS 123094]
MDEAVALLRAFYLAASALILVIQATPALNARFLAYGSRATSPKTAPKTAPQTTPAPPDTPRPATSSLGQLLDYLSTFRVPHGFFAHFYVLSVACSVFWAWCRGHVIWFLMLVQGVRRLFESYPPDPKSKSQMWIGHYLLGLLFYATINIAVWIEQSIVHDHVPSHHWGLVLLPPAILAAHAAQHSYHAHLHRLRKEHTAYQLPSHPLFPNLLCPHYTCEVVIYLLMSFLAAPVGRWVNWTLLSATIFVAVNLGVTAVGTKEWYMQQFGAQKVSGRKRMVPWVW